MQLKKNILITLMILSIFIISSCKSSEPGVQTGTSEPDTQPAAQGTQQTAGSEQPQLDYCSTKIKSAQLKLKSAEKGLENANEDIKKIEDDIKKAQETNDLDEISEKRAESEAAKRFLKEEQEEFDTAKFNLNDIVSKCDNLAKKKDKTICQGFIDDIKEELQLAQNKLTKDKEELNKINALFEEAKKSNAKPEVINAYRKELQEENLEILKDNNKIDKNQAMLKQLQDYCKLE
ncbi:MAG: hypothetical protein AABY07_03350 [Nanoarchaeota archaeon]